MKNKIRMFLFATILILATGCADENVSESISLSVYEKEQTVTAVSSTETEVNVEIDDSEKEIFVTESELPEGEFQNTLCFPDWLGYVNNSTVMNGLYGFKAYEGQGTMYITVSEGVEAFNLFINDQKVDTTVMKMGKTYCVDFSEISVNGENVLQVSNVEPMDADKGITINILYPTVICDESKNAEIDPLVFEIIDEIVKTDIKYGFTAAQLSVIKNGNLVYENGWGRVNSYDENLNRINSTDLVTTDTLFDLASNTKMYSVNYAIQYLVSKGKLSIDDKVCEYIGDEFYENTIDISYRGYVNYGLGTNKQWKKSLTIKDLLCHQAGFPADPKYECEGVNQSTQGLDKSVKNVLFSGNDGSKETKMLTLDAICKTPLMYEPGTMTLYSDVDYMLLGFIIEKITGMELDEFCESTFYEPLGLEKIVFNPLKKGFEKSDIAATEIVGNTREGLVSFTNIRTNTVWGEVHDEKAYYAMGGVSGHAGLFSNATDLAKLCMVALNGGYENHGYFSKDVIDLFVSPKSDEYPEWGLGWWRNAEDERPYYFSSESNSSVYGHQGWTGTLTVIDPKEDLIIVYLTNRPNSPLIDKNKSSSKFANTVYTSGSLGFAPQLVYRGINLMNEESVVYLLSEMVSDSIRLFDDNMATDSESPAVKNAYSKMEVLINYVNNHPSEEGKTLVEKCLLLFDEKRDSENLMELRSLIK